MLLLESSWKVSLSNQHEFSFSGLSITVTVYLYLCKDGPGIKDPCEKETVDATENLTVQQREDITQSAQVR